MAFGQGSDEEMCIDFIFYYPYLQSNSALAPTQYCGFETYGNFEQKTTVTDDGFRVFAVDAGTPDDPTCASAGAAAPSPAGTNAGVTQDKEESGASAAVAAPSLLLAAAVWAAHAAWA